MIGPLVASVCLTVLPGGAGHRRVVLPPLLAENVEVRYQGRVTDKDEDGWALLNRETVLTSVVVEGHRHSFLFLTAFRTDREGGRYCLKVRAREDG
jgi:hypothetical protein